MTKPRKIRNVAEATEPGWYVVPAGTVLYWTGNRFERPPTIPRQRTKETES